MSGIHKIKCGNVNCYIIENGTSGILVDTGKKEYKDKVLEQCRIYNVRLIILTHAHFDHAENTAEISEKLNIPIAMHEKDIDLIKSNNNQTMYADTFLGKIVLAASVKDFAARPMPKFKPNILLNEGDKLSDYGINAEIISLSGHTDGSIGVDVEEKHLIVGDALMNMFYPAVSLLYHNKAEMLKSAEKIGRLSERKIYFGHGKPISNRQWVKKN